jgi:hypothetical protein
VALGGRVIVDARLLAIRSLTRWPRPPTKLSSPPAEMDPQPGAPLPTIFSLQTHN